MKIKTLVYLLFLTSILLSGCMYPDKELTQNQISNQDQIHTVQAAVDSYIKENHGYIPVKTEKANTPIYQKYPVDFKKISPKYLAEPPGNAFESGGDFQYVLIHTETKPIVKLFDLRITEAIRDLNLRIKANGYPPYKKRVAGNLYTIDYKQLGYDQSPYAVSPFTGTKLPFVITGNAEIFVDYRADLDLILKKEHNNVKAGADIRPLLVKNSLFVPAYSLPYTVDPKTNAPVFLEKK